MNAFHSPVGFTHIKSPLFLGIQDLNATLFEFAADAHKENEDECEAWGAEDYVFPSSCFDKATDALLSHPDLRAYRHSGLIELEIEEVLDDDEVDAITLIATKTNIRQRIVFYDLPVNQAIA